MTAGGVASPGSAVSPGTTARQRWLARGAILAAAAAVVLPPVAVGIAESVGVLVVLIAGLVVQLVAGWWFLTHRGLVRWLSGALAVAAPLAVVVFFAAADLLWVVVVVIALWALSLVAAAGALAPRQSTSGPTQFSNTYSASRPQYQIACFAAPELYRMPPPAVKNACRSERRALIAAMLAGLLSHPPHVPSEAMMIALYVAVLIGSVAKAGLDERL